MDKNELYKKRMERSKEIQDTKYACFSVRLKPTQADRRRAYAQAVIECNLDACIDALSATTHPTHEKLDYLNGLIYEARSYVDQMATGQPKDETR